MPYDPERSFGFLLHDIARLLRKRFDQRARALGLSRSQWQVLAHLSRHEGINQSGLAEILEIENITLGRLVDRMGEAGWVERRPDPSFTLKDATSRKYTGKDFPWRNPDAVTLVIEVDRVKFAKIPYTHTPAGAAR